MFHKDLYGLRLKKLRGQAGEKQADLAQLLGVRPNQIVEMENGRKTTSFERLTIICQHYNVSADYLLGLIDEPRPLKKEGQL